MRKAKKAREKSTFRDYFELIAETMIFVFFVMTFVAQASQVPTGSMEDTILIGDFLIINSTSRATAFETNQVLRQFRYEIPSSS